MGFRNHPILEYRTGENSRLQKYHLTEKGCNLLDSLDGRNDK